MTLNQCTKEELITIINRMAGYGSFSKEQRQTKIERYVRIIVFDRTKKLLNEADNWNKIAADYRQKYYDLLKPYDGKKLIDIPIDVIKKAEKLLKEAQRADKKWDECMRKVDDYGR